MKPRKYVAAQNFAQHQNLVLIYKKLATIEQGPDKARLVYTNLYDSYSVFL
jgi:hypothetical protein